MSFATTAQELPLTSVRVSSVFWAGRVRAAREGALPAMYDQMKETGRWDCLKLKWKPGEPNKPHRFWDSDVAKWLEAACYALVHKPDPILSRLVEEAVDMIRGAQQEDGYINTYYTVVEPGKRWTNVAWSHEMYCAGHLLEAALAHYIYSGSSRLLSPVLRYVAHIRSIFGPGSEQKRGYPGHEELELALLKMYSYLSSPSAATSTITDEERQTLLDLASYFIEERGHLRPEKGGHYFDVEARDRGDERGDAGPAPEGAPRFAYYQANETVRETKDVEGHAVRAMYWLTAVAHLARVKQDAGLQAAAERLWASTTRKMYISGGLGAVGDWEGFGPDFHLPNESGYLETCAAIGLVLFAHQLALTSPFNSRYAAILERALYNAVLVGMSADGRSFFYENPLATVGKRHTRRAWFDVSCCPPNVARLLGALGMYIYSFTPEPRGGTLHVRMFAASEVELAPSVLRNDVSRASRKLKIVQSSSAPWSGGATFHFEGDVEGVKIALRQPEGSTDFRISTIDGAHERTVAVNQVAQEIFVVQLEQLVTADGTRPLHVNFTHALRILRPHPLDSSNHACIALARGPVIYCVESVDVPDVLDLRALRVPRNLTPSDVETVHDEQLEELGVDGAVVLRLRASVLAEDGGGKTVQLKMVPLFLWANRGPADVRVWLPTA